jgi:CDP-diacylglycerol---glycerol-3-phosphate 3-phosphatidyltransferase
MDLKMKVNLADLLTVSRIFLAFPVFFLLVDGMLPDRIFAAILFCLAGLTDYFDGKIARMQGKSTHFGKFLDPLADKILVISILVALTILSEIPLWIVILIITREILVTFLRVGNVEKFSPTIFAKFKTVVQMSGIVIILFLPFLQLNSQKSISYLIMMIVLFFTLVSGIQYVVIKVSRSHGVKES